MADKHDVVIGIGTRADLAGCVQTEKQLDRLRQKARELGKETGKQSSGMISGFRRVGESVNQVRGAVMNLGGATAVISGIVAAYKSWRAAAREVADEVANVNVDAAKKSIEEIAAAERNVADEIERGRRARETAAALDQKRVQIARDMEDAELRKREALEKANVGAGPDRDLELKRIEEKYASIRAGTSADRQVQDAEDQANAMREQADAAEAEAKALEDAAVQQREIARQEGRMAARDSASAARASGRAAWWRFWDDSADVAESKTATAKAHAEAASSAASTASWMESSAAAKRDEAARLRAESVLAASRVGSIRASQDADMVEIGLRSDETRREQDRRDRQREQDRNGLSAANSGRLRVQAQIDAARRRLEQVRDERAANGLEAARAGSAYDLAVANGRPKREQSAAYEARRQAMRRVQDANYALDKSEQALLASISALTERLKDLERTASAAEKRVKANQSDSQGGD